MRTAILVPLLSCLVIACGSEPAGADEAVQGGMLKNKPAPSKPVTQKVAPAEAPNKALVGEDALIGEEGKQFVAPKKLHDNALIGEDGKQINALIGEEGKQIVAPDQIQNNALIGEEGKQIVAPDQ